MVLHLPEAQKIETQTYRRYTAQFFNDTGTEWKLLLKGKGMEVQRALYSFICAWFILYFLQSRMLQR